MSVDDNETRYQLLLEDDDSVLYQPSPKFHTTATSNAAATIQDLGKRFRAGLHSVDLLSSLHAQPIDTDAENEAFDKGLDRYLLNINTFEVKYVKFPLEITKKQVRCRGQPNQMRLHQEDAKIILNLVFENVTFRDIYKVKLKVRRLNSFPNYLKYYTGLVTLDPVEFQDVEDSPNTVVVYANLDHLEGDDNTKNMYELSKSNPEHNQFVLYIEVFFYDASSSNFTTRSFTVKGQRLEKRKVPGSPDSSSSSSGGKSPKLFDSFRDPSENKNFANHQRLVCEIIEAKQGIFDNLEANIIKTGKGDIAYHFVLKDQTTITQYEPGEIVGFTTDQNGKVVIDKLSPSNANKTFLKGVVTESQYIEAHLPEDRNVITATICMLGVVPVRVMGPVLPGEGLFASQERPGTAISERFIGSSKNDAHIGYAFESVDSKETEINEVQGLVSIISSAGQDLCVRQLSVLEKSLKHSIKFNTVRSRKCFTLLAVVMVLGCLLIGTVIYQVKVPCSLYKKYICKEGNTGSVKYWYWNQGGEYFGYQFKSCSVVWEKTIKKRQFFKRPHSQSHGPAKCINGTTKSGKIIKFNYYINFDSCCGVDVPGSRYMFAVDEGCQLLYLFDDVFGKWHKDERICSEKCNIECGDGKSCRKSSDPCPKDELGTIDVYY